MTVLNQANVGKALLKAATQYAGLPYVYGYHDCSWLTETAAGDVGIIVPRTSEEQVLLYQIGPKVPYEVGDFIFIEGSPIDANPGHVMIYMSPGMVFEAEETGTLIGAKPYDTSQFEFRTRPALAYPTAAQVAKYGLVQVNAANAATAVRNGWHRRYWNGKTFATTPPNPLRTTCLYVVENWRQKR